MAQLSCIVAFQSPHLKCLKFHHRHLMLLFAPLCIWISKFSLEFQKKFVKLLAYIPRYCCCRPAWVRELLNACHVMVGAMVMPACLRGYYGFPVGSSANSSTGCKGWGGQLGPGQVRWEWVFQVFLTCSSDVQSPWKIMVSSSELLLFMSMLVGEKEPCRSYIFFWGKHITPRRWRW